MGFYNSQTVGTKEVFGGQAKKATVREPRMSLQQEFLKPLGITRYRLAKDISLPARRINEIVLRKRSITADTALRLARYFGTTAELWTGLQADYDLRLARYEKQTRIEHDIEPLVVLHPVMV